MKDTKAPSTLLDLLQAAPGTQTAILLPETGTRISYSALREQVKRMADSLAGHGIGHGDRVAMALPNGLPTIVSFLAASIAGTAAPLNPGYRQDEFSFYMEDTSAKILIVPPEGADEARRAAEGKVRVVVADMASENEVRIEPPPVSRSAAPPAPEDVALVLHTSGSTGRPKRVPLMHLNLSISARNVANTYALTGEDAALCVMPLFHVHGLVASTLATLLTGGTVVVPSRFNPLSFWRTVRDCGASWYSAVPTIHQLALARTGGRRPEGIERLRFVRSCSAALPVDIGRKMEELYGVPVLEAYGMTEASHQMASNPLPPAPHKLGTVGPGTGVRISILGPGGKHLGPDELGEVVIQGPNVIGGYENNPEANASSFLEGWFRTGDQGVLDADGFLRLTGRLKEMINRGGEKIAPLEIDDVLRSHPAVNEAVSFGTPHPTWGEEVAAAVVLSGPATEADLLAHCRERMADFKCPKKIYFVEAIPRTATGKIQRLNVASHFAKAAS